MTCRYECGFFLRPTPLLFVFNYCFQVLAEICVKRWKKLLEKKTKKNCRIYKAKNMFYPTPYIRTWVHVFRVISTNIRRYSYIN